MHPCAWLSESRNPAPTPTILRVLSRAIPEVRASVTPADVDVIARRLIRETHKWAVYGFAVTVDEPEYERLLGGRWALPPNAYGFALYQSMIIARRWMDRVKFDGEISYFLEDGNEHRGEADRFLCELIQKSPDNREKYRYRTHGFLPKATHWLHPADYLAWHWSQEMKRQQEANRTHRVRQDLIALVDRPQDVAMHFSSERLAVLADRLTARYGAREPDWNTFSWSDFRRADVGV